MSEQRQEEIHEKGFLISDENYSYSRKKQQRISLSALEDLVVELEGLDTILPENYGLATRSIVMSAIAGSDVALQRRISRLFYKISGIYQKVCNSFAFLYRYDWYATPQIYNDNIDKDKTIKDFRKLLDYLDNSYIREMCGNIALKVIVDGLYFGYIVPNKECITIQDLPLAYCRSSYLKNGEPVVEFDLSYFDSFVTIQKRMSVLKIFPAEFVRGYVLYKKDKLKTETGERTNWLVLDPDYTISCSLNKSILPIFLNAIPTILDLDEAQEVDKARQRQTLLKLLVQILPTDKNGDLIFDLDEAQQIHDTAKRMLQGAMGTKIITTFSDIKAINLDDSAQPTTVDAQKRVERAVYNALGVSQNLFNSSGNISMEKSVLNTESCFRDLLFQFNRFLNKAINKCSNFSKKYNFRIYLLETTQYNYRDLSKLYKEQTQMGYSKLLPQVALGLSQSFILNTVYFENKTLDLSQIMIPPLMSSTMSGKALPGEEKEVGRPPLEEGEKSDKTLQNEQSLS